MRGAERPAKVQWTRPFLQPLKPLTQDAARKIFLDIADDEHDTNDVDKILLLTDNMPLAIDLLTHLVDMEGCSNVLSRWEAEKTSMLSEGYNQISNLDYSISLSLLSPRITSQPHSQDLLGLLSILPDGLSDTDLLQSKLPIEKISTCKAALLRTSLIYATEHNRMKVLVPIREYMQKFHPPGNHVVKPLLKHFQDLLVVARSQVGMMARITSNLANIQSLLSYVIYGEKPDEESLCGILHLNSISLMSNHGSIPLMNQIPDLLPQPTNYKLEILYIIECINAWRKHPIHNPKLLFERALEYFHHLDDTDLQCTPSRSFHLPDTDKCNR